MRVGDNEVDLPIDRPAPAGPGPVHPVKHRVAAIQSIAKPQQCPRLTGKPKAGAVGGFEVIWDQSGHLGESPGTLKPTWA
jgi:hypothetical protein